MARSTDSNRAGEDPVLPVSLAWLRCSASDEHIAQLQPKAPTLNGHAPRTTLSSADEEDDLALAIKLSLLSHNDIDEQATRPPSRVSATTSQQAHFPTQSNRDNDSLASGVNLPQPSGDASSVDAGQPPSRLTAVNDGPTPSPKARSFLKVRTIPP